MQCFAIACVSVYFIGWSSATVWPSLKATAGIGDFSKAFLYGIDAGTLSGDIPEPLFFIFQMTFAIITPALIVGAFAERMKFPLRCYCSVRLG